MGSWLGSYRWLKKGKLESKVLIFTLYFDIYILHKSVLIILLRNLDQQLLSAIVDLFHVLWFTNLGQKEKQMEGAKSSSSTEEKPQSSMKCLPLPLISEFLCVASTISRHLR